MDKYKNIKIADFGLSNLYTNNQLLKTPCGSPCYAAPEMLLGHKYNGLLIDIWSSGVILFAVLCGYLPFEDENTRNLYKKIIEGDFKLPNWLSLDAQDLMNKILNVEPKKRIRIKEIRQHKWMIDCDIINEENKNIDQNIIKEMVKMGYDQIVVEQCLNNNKHNFMTTTYYLLKKKGKEKESVLINNIQKIPPLFHLKKKIINSHQKQNTSHQRANTSMNSSIISNESDISKNFINEQNNQIINNKFPITSNHQVFIRKNFLPIIQDEKKRDLSMNGIENFKDKNEKIGFQKMHRRIISMKK